ncbi:MAG: carbohydrate ABC transporter permease [Eubacteriales bacterium]|nr:carbohydrate ABC transporter permease [Eubacteriales bacterium]
MKLKRIFARTIYHAFMIAFSLLMLYPLLWMISASLKPSDQIMITADQLIPRTVTFSNYIEGWRGFARYSFATYFKNSILISVVRVVGTVISASLSAFGFARIRFKTRSFWFAVMIGTMCLPGMVLQIPQYLMFNKLGWVGTFRPLLIPCWFGGGAFNIFLLMQFMKNIPRDMDEAATIDGCGWWRLFTRIMLPLIVPAICSVAVLTFIGAWGDFYSSLIYLNKPAYYPVAYALKLYSDEVSTNYGPMLAMSVLSLVPIMILFVLFQKSLVEGISTSGIKG